MMNAKSNWQVLLGALLALLFVLIVQRALPFLTVPTNLQAFWTMGFAQSFANQSLLSVYAVNFGLPEPAPIMFGLAGAYPAGLLVAAGLQPADAYAASAALWLSLAFLSAWRLSRSWGAGGHAATLLATLWMASPIVFGHAGYSMVAFGIALLPFYFLAASRLWSLGGEAGATVRARDAALFWIACQVSVFMDGYSFMMFAVGASLLAAYRLARISSDRVRLALVAGPVHGGGLVAAYLLYAAYIGRPEFEANSLDFFRGFGADVTFFVIPTATVSWLWDILGLSVIRSRTDFFGDQSAWTTTFSLPLIVIGLVAWWKTRKHSRMAGGWLLLALFGFYMALGPSLKVNSVRPVPAEKLAAAQLDSTMSAELAVMPTGSGWLSENVPGFRNMRAAYRWTALGLFALWALAALMLAQARGRQRTVAMAAIAFVVLSYMPNLKDSVLQGMANHRLFATVDRTLVADIRSSVSPAEKLAILPFDNDFLAGYLAARAKVHVFNIGGDKNLANAQRHWPPLLMQLGLLDPSFPGEVLLLLANQEVDVALLPYVDIDRIGRGLEERLSPLPLDRKATMAPVVEQLRRSGLLAVDELPYFALVRLTPELRGRPAAEIIYRAILATTPYPWTPPRSGLALANGWHSPEAEHVWSMERAMLNLPVPDNCGACYAVLKFGVLTGGGAAQVRFSLGRDGTPGYWTETLPVSKPGGHSVAIPMAGRRGLQQLAIEAPARSPSSLGISPDDRPLGLALRSVDMVTMRYPLVIAQRPDPRQLAFTLSEGWYPPELEHVWSEGRAIVNLPVPDSCGVGDCYALLRFGVFAASEDRPVKIRFSLRGGGTARGWTQTLVARKPNGHALAIPMRGRTGLQQLTLDVAGVTSPKALGVSGDERVIGISLRSLEMIDPGNYSVRIGEVGSAETLGFVLSEGWHLAESKHVWSEGQAAMNIPVPRQCRDCGVLLKFDVFAADETRPVNVRFALTGDGAPGPWTEDLTARRPAGHSLFIPLHGRRGLQRLAIEIPMATSPQTLGLSADARTLGIALRSAEIVTNSSAAQP